MILELATIIKLREILSDYGNNPIFFLCLFVIIPISLIISFISLILIFRKLHFSNQKTKIMREFSQEIQRGASVYLRQQSRTLLIVLAILIVPVGLTGINLLNQPLFGFILSIIIFLIGAFSSLFAGYIGMKAATKSNILVLEAAIDDPNEGFKLAYYAGMITGILNISMFVLGVWLLFIFTAGNVYILMSYGFGASVAALLAQVGGGIFTKSADISADLVGKYEMSIEEDDARNPAIIADLVGDNVGDCAGRGADLFESASSDAIGGMSLGLFLFAFTGNPIFIIANLTLITVGIYSLFFTVLFLKIDFKKPSKSIWSVFSAAIFFNITLLFFMNLLLFGVAGFYLFIASVIGLLSVFIAIIFTIYYTSIDYKNTRKVAEASKDNPSLTILSGISGGFNAAFFPILVFCASLISAYYFGYIFEETIINSTNHDIFGSTNDQLLLIITFGIWGVNLASVSSDLIISTVLSFDTFGPITDNAAGIAELGKSEGSPDLRNNLDKLDALGNTTKAIAKGFALICGGFSSIVMFLTFLISTHSLAKEIPSKFIPSNQMINIFDNLDIYHPLMILGIFVGVLIPVLFSSMIIRAVTRGSSDLVQEIRHQFKDIPGLREGKATPNYMKCINLCARNALKKMIWPVLVIIIITLSIGILFGPMVIAALLIGNLIGCLIFGLFMSIGGASLDNAKKGIELGLFGGKGSFAHKSAIIGDTVGDPLKDTAGPSMNILITTINTMTLTFLPLFILTGFIWALIPI